jgi:hypothetical protein
MFTQKEKEDFPQVHEMAGTDQFCRPITRLFYLGIIHILEQLFFHFSLFISGKGRTFEITAAPCIVYI